MPRFAALLIVLAAVAVAIVLLRPDREDATSEPAAAPEPAGRLAQGIERARAAITVRRGDMEYELIGGLDLSEGYRFRGRVKDSSYRYLDDGTPIWLAGGPGSVGGLDTPDTLTRPDFSFDRDGPIWFDDHPPTLPLTRAPRHRYDPNYMKGAEVYAHLSLLALKHGRYGAAFDFAPYSERNDLSKVGKAAGTTRIDATADPAGTLERLRLDLPPAAVEVRLYPSDRPVRALELRRFAME